MFRVTTICSVEIRCVNCCIIPVEYHGTQFQRYIPQIVMDALEQTVRNLVGEHLNHARARGTSMQPSTMTFSFSRSEIVESTVWGVSRREVFDRLDMQETTIGSVTDSSLLSKGYKIGFFRAREYRAPIYRETTQPDMSFRMQQMLQMVAISDGACGYRFVCAGPWNSTAWSNSSIT